jgi:MAPEG family
MPITLWVLLGFAAWTLLLLFATVGVYRWTRILTGRATIAAWRVDEPQGSEWYRRAVRAHMNCVENLPIYTAIVVALTCHPRHQSNPRRIGNRDTPCENLSERHPLALRTNEYRREHSFRILFRPSRFHDVHGRDLVLAVVAPT